MSHTKPIFYFCPWNSEPKQVEFYTWYDITDEYYMHDSNLCSVVSYMEDDRLQIVPVLNCTIGWNVLKKIGAKIMFIEKPE